MNRGSRRQPTSGTLPGTSASGPSESSFLRHAVLGALVAGGATLALIISTHLPLMHALMGGINGAALFLCGFDKSIAGGRVTRVPEAILLLFALLGGTLGLICGMIIFRHKTRKASFILRLGLIFVIQMVGYSLFDVRSPQSAPEEVSLPSDELLIDG